MRYPTENSRNDSAARVSELDRPIVRYPPRTAESSTTTCAASATSVRRQISDCGETSSRSDTHWPAWIDGVRAWPSSSSGASALCR